MSKGLITKFLLGWLLVTNLWVGAGGRAEAYTVQTTRPRIWLTPQTLTHLRQQAAAKSPRWVALQANCDAFIGETSPWMANTYNYALAYQITGDPRYGDKA